MRYANPLLALSIFIATPAIANDKRTGDVAESAVGKAGQRQTRDKGVEGIEPMARIDSRIPNRVQSRFRNRLDRYYDPQANTTSPFEVAADKNRVSTRRK